MKIELVRKGMLSIFIVAAVFTGYAQKTITGQVTAFNKFPLKNVDIEAKKSKQMVKTDSLGLFQIEVSDKDKIQFKSEGFYPVVYKTNNEESMNVNLIYIDTKKSFAAVVENGVLSEEELSEALENYIDQNNNFEAFSNIFEVVQSVYPSIVVDDTSSPVRLYMPGRGGPNDTPGHEALLVVNKIMTFDISDISPTQVKSVKVLSGNDATLMYGNRGSNGVVEIELK